MLNILIVGIGGFVGAVARYGVSGVVQRGLQGSFPGGTLIVNVLGCLVLGALTALVDERPGLSAHARRFLAIGLLGSFTTFSTLGHETLDLMRRGDYRVALTYVATSFLLGLGALGLGRAGVGFLSD